jgi:hypothetical protein
MKKEKAIINEDEMWGEGEEEQRTGARRRHTTQQDDTRTHTLLPHHLTLHLPLPPPLPQFFDENLDGFITVQELQAIYRQVAAESGGSVDVPKEDELKKMIAEADADGDGKLSEEEFYAIIEACA